jgi:hypothetical protein
MKLMMIVAGVGVVVVALLFVAVAGVVVMYGVLVEQEGKGYDTLDDSGGPEVRDGDTRECLEREKANT